MFGILIYFVVLAAVLLTGGPLWAAIGIGVIVQLLVYLNERR